MTREEWAHQHGIRWAALANDLQVILRLTRDVWPREFRDAHDKELLDTILASEPGVRSSVDAAVRTLTRQKLTPPLSELEMWHLRHRIELGAELCGTAVEDSLPYPDIDAEDQLEGLLVESWPILLPRWQEKMKLRSEELRECDAKCPPKPPPAAD
jgi:hypothetical protein